VQTLLGQEAQAPTWLVNWVQAGQEVLEVQLLALEVLVCSEALEALLAALAEVVQQAQGMSSGLVQTVVCPTPERVYQGKPKLVSI
jgi:hypothetical protein